MDTCLRQSTRSCLTKVLTCPLVCSLVQTVLGQVVDVPVVVQRQVRGSELQKIVEIPQFPFIAGRRHPGHGAEADCHGFTVQ